MGLAGEKLDVARAVQWQSGEQPTCGHPRPLGAGAPRIAEVRLTYLGQRTVVSVQKQAGLAAAGLFARAAMGGDECRADVLQLCGLVPWDDLRRVRDALPGVRLMHVIHVTGEDSIDEGVEMTPFVDAILLDTGSRTGPVRELGGTGRTHDWSISRRIVPTTDRPVFLSGGLNSVNVAEAIATVTPYGVDICNGVRSDGRLDPVKLGAFMQAVASVGTSAQ